MPLVLLSIIWGIAFVAVKALEPMLTPVNLTLLRWFAASAGFLVLAPLLGKLKNKFERRDLPRFLLVSLANVVTYHLALNYSESTISAGLAVMFVALGPVFIVLLSRAFLGERPGKLITLSVALALFGGFVLYVGSQYSGSYSLPGILESLGSAVSYSVFAVFSKPLVHKYGAIPFTIWTGLIGTAMLLPLLSGSFILQVTALPVDGWIAILYLSLLSTVLGYVMFYTLVGRGMVSKLSIQLYLIPVVAVIGGVLILGETVTVFTIAGGAAMLLSVGLATNNPVVKEKAAN